MFRSRSLAAITSGAGLALALACASTAPLALPGRSALEGRLRLEPRDGVSKTGGGNAYGDRRLRDARRVDYDRPGFSVVYVDEANPVEPLESGPPPQKLVIREGAVSPRFEPAEMALRFGVALEVVNATNAPHVVSVPDEGAVHALEPGHRVSIELARPGAQHLYLLDVAGAESLVFAAPGPFTVPRSTGEYALGDLTPGDASVRVWHPRFPPTAVTVSLQPDIVTPLDLVLGVGRDALSSNTGTDATQESR